MKSLSLTKQDKLIEQGNPIVHDNSLKYAGLWTQGNFVKHTRLWWQVLTGRFVLMGGFILMGIIVLAALMACPLNVSAKAIAPQPQTQTYTGYFSHKDPIVYEEHYTYNQDGQVETESSWHEDEGRYAIDYKYFYTNKLLTAKTYYSGGYKSEKTFYTYNEKKLLISERTYNYNLKIKRAKKPYQRIYYTYDTKGRLTKKVTKSASATLSKELIEYDRASRLLTRTIYTYEDRPTKDVMSYTYALYANGATKKMAIRQTRYTYTDNTFKKLRSEKFYLHDIYYYDETGLLKKIVCKDVDGLVYTKYQYKYRKNRTLSSITTLLCNNKKLAVETFTNYRTF